MNASADGTVTLPGSPLIVSVGSLGECQSSYPNVGGANFYPPSDTLGDCGFFLAFPPAIGNPAALEQSGKTGSVFGFDGAAGPHIVSNAEGGVLYQSIAQGAPTGSGTAGDPYKEITTFKASIEGKDYALITVTTTYVNGAADFTSSYDVQNVTGQTIPGLTTPTAATLHFHAIVAGDLYVANSDLGTGVFSGGPPRFIGGQNTTTGTLGGFFEATPEWSNWQEGGYFEPIWEAVNKSTAATPVFNDTIDPNLIDNGTGVSWDQFLTTGLPAGEHAIFTIVNRSQVPTTLGVQPVQQTHTVGQTATVTVTATDNIGTPYGNRSLVYSIGGANPKTGSVTTDGAGQAVISYVGTAAGLDTLQMFLDLNGNGSANNGEPASAAQVTWTPAPPTPNSTYTIQKIRANSNGTITIVFVPTQDGTAIVEVTVPTASISRNASIAKKKKCKKKNQVRIKGKCRPRTSVSGKVSAQGKAGVPLAITVKPSSKVKKALAKGKKVQLTAKLTYKSALGGTPTVKTFHFTVKGKKKKKKHH
ncbi:MAG TPA: hypothetical protein VLJ80_05705 [Solirubrobacteraceae bacterium]|nr:hypothetical protein [Solirubrobacteraceae bacterium]